MWKTLEADEKQFHAWKKSFHIWESELSHWTGADHSRNLSVAEIVLRWAVVEEEAINVRGDDGLGQCSGIRKRFRSSSVLVKTYVEGSGPGHTAPWGII